MGIAKGRFAKVVVFRGSKAKTTGGLTSTDLIKNKRGKIVSKKASLRAKKNNFIKGWTTAVQKARKALGLKGFVAIKKGSALYKKAKELFTSERTSTYRGFSSGRGDVYALRAPSL